MQEFWIRLKVRDNGTLEECEYFSKKMALEKLIGKRTAVRRDDFFKALPHDEPDVAAVKQAVDMLGGSRVLASQMGVSRSTVYQWVLRGKIPYYCRSKVYELAQMRTPEFKAKYFTNGSWEKILDE